MTKFDSEGYYRDHKYCPQCGETDVCRTTAGMGFPFPGKDTNDARCQCGWRGEVHDLVAEAESAN